MAITKSGKHHWQYGFTTYGKNGDILYSTEKTMAITEDINQYLIKSLERYARKGVRFEYRNLIDLDAENK